MTLGDLIRQRREMLGLSQVELAQRADVSQSLITLMEQNKRGTRIDSVVKVADVLGIAPDVVFDFIRGDGPKEAQAPARNVLDQVSDLMKRIEVLERGNHDKGSTGVRPRVAATAA